MEVAVSQMFQGQKVLEQGKAKTLKLTLAQAGQVGE